MYQMRTQKHTLTNCKPLKTISSDATDCSFGLLKRISAKDFPPDMDCSKVLELIIVNINNLLLLIRNIILFDR